MQEKLQAFRKYISDVERERVAGKATEPTYYSYLKSLLEGLATGIAATINPKRIECGAPDFEVSRGETRVGYVEAKDVGTSLDAIEKDARRATPTTRDGDQLKRYLGGLGNLVLTDYLEFRWYVDGEKRGTARVGIETHDGKIKRDKKGIEAAGNLLSEFLAREPEAVGTPKELAVRMARLAHMIREFIVVAFGKEAEGGSLHGQFLAFRDHLIPDLSVEQFADMYAQTVAYGLFAARATGNSGQKFTRENAAYLLPKTNPFLRRLFNHIAGPELDDRIVGLVDDLAQVIGRTDMAAVLAGLGKHTKQEDPVVHFYETFLKAYDPKERKLRGVYYTPEPVVSYIVRSVDYLLGTRFGQPLGLADPTVLILDPAVGTGTFLYEAVKLVHERLQEQGQAGAWSDYVAEKLLPRLFGFELLMAPYAVAHLKVGLLLQELGYEFRSDQRLGIYLTNALGEGVHPAQYYGMGRDLAEEGNAAGEIKKSKPIMVVLGNPPYAGHSANRSYTERPVNAGREYLVRIAGTPGSWVKRTAKRDVVVREPTFIGELLQDYYVVDGHPLDEKNPKWLQDDYVKFLRFGQWRIDRTGQGVLAFITNHSYLDNPTFRGMRQSLMNTFTDIYILDMHGNERKKERCPDGSPDENVFDIQQGVAIGIFVREPGKSGPAKVHHADLWGLRRVKEGVLAEMDVAATEWAEIAPTAPFYLFVPQELKLWNEYQAGWGIVEVMPVNVTGFQTHRDHFATDFERSALRERIGELRRSDLTDSEVAERYEIRDNRDWHMSEARAQVRSMPDWEGPLMPCLYRPFDWRWCYFSTVAMDYPRTQVMRHIIEGSLAVLLPRRSAAEWQHVLVSDRVAVDVAISSGSREANQVFPLYLYPQEGLMAAEGRQANLSKRFTDDVSLRLGMKFIADGRGDLEGTFGPEDVFHYIYAVFHSPTYRSRYREFLKIDFPRVPLTSDRKLFAALAAKGADLVGLHLMESRTLDALITKWPVAGSDTVEKVRYDERERRVWINETQYFEGVPPEVWGFHIGGYQVCEKWLKDRKGRKLTWDDVQHYQKVVVALAETIRLMGEIDAIIPGWPLE